MPRERLEELVAQLNDELDQTDAADADAHATLLALRDEIDEALRRSEPVPEDPHTLRERIQHGIEKLERTHPKLVSAMDGVLRALADLGI